MGSEQDTQQLKQFTGLDQPQTSSPTYFTNGLYWVGVKDISTPESMLKCQMPNFLKNLETEIGEQLLGYDYAGLFLPNQFVKRLTYKGESVFKALFFARILVRSKTSSELYFAQN